ncbi:MAG: Crp/Fnr family transcriptional regulator, partial [Bacillota bacterium]
DLEFLHRRVKAGGRLCSQGEALEALYVIRSGCIKTFVNDECGNQVVVGFPMKGDLVGADGLCDRIYSSYAVALNDVEVAVIPFRALSTLGRSLEDFDLLLYRAISRELVVEHAIRSVIGSLRAEARVARFIAQYADRLRNHGGDSRRFTLPMTRQEIGSYLGLTIETVSRSFTALHDARLVDVTQREVEILDETALKTLQKLPVVSRAKTSGAAQPVRRPVRRNVTWSDMLGAAA